MKGTFSAVEVDASYGEGGGQLLRTAVALAALTGARVRLTNVRANRPHPGLAPQHLAAVRAIAALCDARSEGLEPGSTRLAFAPRVPPAGGEVRVDVGTAGSVTLVLQALLPVLVGAPASSRVVVTGGTDVRQAPSWDYFCRVLLRLLARMGLAVRPSISRRGYYPRGGGEVAIHIEPGVPRPLVPAQSAPRWRIAGAAHVAKLPPAIADRMRAAALAVMGGEGYIESRVLGHAEAIGAGGAITVWAESDAGLLGASRVAERGVPAEQLGEAVGREIGADLASGAALDAHAADQVLVYMAMAEGDSTFAVREVSRHARTAMWLIPQFLPVRFEIEEGRTVSHIRARPGPRRPGHAPSG